MLLNLLTLCCLLMPVQSDDPIFSGPQPGEKLPPFRFTVVDGAADEERQADVVSQADGGPVVLLFVHERSRPAFGLANVVMRLVASRGSEKITGGLVYLVEDPTEAANWMNRIRNYFPAGITRGIYKGGVEGPGVYGLNRNVAITALVAKDGVVTANYALVQPSLETDAPKIFKSIAEVLGEAKVPEVSQFAQNNMRRGRMRPPAGRNGAQDPKLRPLLVPLIQKSATDAEVDAAAKKVEEYAADHPEARQQIGDIARRIIQAGKLSNYGTARCQHYLKQWAKNFSNDTATGQRKSKQEQSDEDQPTDASSGGSTSTESTDE